MFEKWKALIPKLLTQFLNAKVRYRKKAEMEASTIKVERKRLGGGLLSTTTSRSKNKTKAKKIIKRNKHDDIVCFNIKCFPYYIPKIWK